MKWRGDNIQSWWGNVNLLRTVLKQVDLEQGQGLLPLRPKEKFGTLHEFACHPCAGAMLIFSVSFQF